MSQPQPAPMADTLGRRRFDRRLYLVAAIAFPLIVLAGFGPTYYAKGLFASPPLPSGLVHVHGLVMSAWVALFVVQVRFIAARQVRLHQRLGYAAVGLAALVIATGIPTALRAAKYGSAATPPDVPPLAFLAVPLFDLVMFAVFFSAAIAYRRQPAAHKSLMLLTAINFLPPAIARIPVPALQALGPLWFFGVPSVLAALVVALDARRHGRVNRVFLAGTLLLVASYIGRLVLMTTDPWLRLATWMTGFV
jgi:hypothetical protein